ncbi:MAG: tetratricopeptide repeat protein, partial [Thermoanaerobaculia bacterium]
MRGWSLPWLVLGLAGAGIGPGAEPPLRIQADAPYTRTLSSGETHLYNLALDAGDYARLEVVQQGLDVETVVRGPSGAEIVEVDSPTGRFSTESVSLVAEETGDYQIEVRTSYPGDIGNYKLALAALHEAGPDDRLRVEAERTDLEAVRSLEAARLAPEKWRALRDRLQEGRALTRLGKALEASGQRPDALAAYEEALSLQRELNDREGLAETLDKRGRTLSLLGDGQRALEALQESFGLWQELHRLDSAAMVSMILGDVHQSFGDSSAAVTACELGLKLSRETADRAQESQALNCLGKVRFQVGQPLQALDDLRMALELARSTRRLTYEAQTLSNLGSLYRDLGMPHDALEHYAKAREIFHAQNVTEGEALALISLGNLLFQLGALEEARELLEQSLPLQHDPRYEAMALISLSRIAEELGDVKEASALNDRALKLQRGARYRAGEAESLRAQGLLLLETGKAVEAEKSLRESLSIYESLGYRSRAAAARQGLGRALTAQGRTDEARQAYEEARKDSESLGDIAAQAVTLAEQGRLEHLAGDLPAARKRLEAALNLMEDFRSEVGGDSLRAQHFSTVRATYERYVDVLMQLHRADPKAGLDARAFELAEQSRARGLLDVLAHAQVDTREGDPKLMERELRLRQELNAKAALRLTLGDDDASQTRSAALEKEIEALTTDHQIVEALLTKGSSYESLKKPSLAVSQIQALLDPQTVLLEYLLGEPRSYLWVVSSASLKAYELPGRRAIAERARSLHEHLKNPAERDVAGQRDDLRLLSQEVLGPALAEIADRRLIIVSDGALQYVPFAALPIRSKAGATVFLVEEHEIGFLPSAAVLKEIRRVEAGRPRRPISI